MTRKLQPLFNESFATHSKEKYWSKKNLVNPENVYKGTNVKYWFDCDVCTHDFEKSLNKINNRWCPYCANQKLCDDINCKECYKKSFAYHSMSKYWSKKNEKKPRDVFKCSGKKYWFDCNKCNHAFNITLHSTKNNIQKCPYCAHQKLCTKVFCFDNSFASHPKHIYWSYKNTLLPREVFKNTHVKYWFDCDICNNDFDTQLNSVNKGSWCSICKHKTEKKFLAYFKEKYHKFTIIHQPKFSWCKNSHTGRNLPFDFSLLTQKIIFEIDGPQHFEQVSNWTTPEITQKCDKYKEQCASNNNFTVFRFLQIDIWNDRNNWKEILHDIVIGLKK